MSPFGYLSVHRGTSSEQAVREAECPLTPKDYGDVVVAFSVTRPDLAYSVARLAQCVASPTPEAYARAARILRYLKGTLNTSISYSPVQREMHAYVDSDWAGDPSRYSQSGFVFMYQDGPISWISKKQPTIALSSTEAEIIAATLCTQEALWYTGCLKELKLDVQQPMCLYEDNAAAIILSKTSVIGKRMRHIDVKYKFLNECVERELVELAKVNGLHNVADIFTKPLARDRFVMLASRMAHSTSLANPQPMTADQDGPTCRCVNQFSKIRCDQQRREPKIRVSVLNLVAVYTIQCNIVRVFSDHMYTSVSLNVEILFLTRSVDRQLMQLYRVDYGSVMTTIIRREFFLCVL